MPKRPRFDFANKVDPETGVRTRFCSRCEEFLTHDKFNPCYLKRGTLLCKQHANALGRAAKRRWVAKQRGEGEAKRALSRIRSNMNHWIHRDTKGRRRWTNDDVALALQKHAINLATEPRIVRFRPRDPELAFDAENSVVKFQNGSCARRPTT